MLMLVYIIYKYVRIYLGQGYIDFYIYIYVISYNFDFMLINYCFVI